MPKWTTIANTFIYKALNAVDDRPAASEKVILRAILTHAKAIRSTVYQPDIEMVETFGGMCQNDSKKSPPSPYDSEQRYRERGRPAISLIEEPFGSKENRFRPPK